MLSDNSHELKEIEELPIIGDFIDRYSPDSEEKEIEKFIRDTQKLFEEKGMIPKDLKINPYSPIKKNFLNSVHSSDYSDEEYKILKIIEKLINLLYFKFHKNNPRIIHLLCDIIIVFMYFIFSNNEEINLKINTKIFEEEEFERGCSGSSFNDYLYGVESGYDRFSNRILYMIIVYLISKKTNDVSNSFIEIINRSLKNNKKFKIYLSCFIDNRFFKIHCPDRLLNDCEEIIVEGSIVITKKHNKDINNLFCECKKFNSEKDCSNCEIMKSTSNFPFIITIIDEKFYLIDLARNFEFTDLERQKKLEVRTEIQANKVYSINIGSTTVVFELRNI